MTMVMVAFNDYANAPNKKSESSLPMWKRGKKLRVKHIGRKGRGKEK